MLFTGPDPFDRTEQYDNLATEVAAWLKENGIAYPEDHSDLDFHAAQWVALDKKPQPPDLDGIHEDIGAYLSRQDPDDNFEVGAKYTVWFER